MPQKARQKSNTKAYHVIVRGNAKQDRFLSKSVETEKYLKTLCRYIHQNSYKSGIKTIYGRNFEIKKYLRNKQL